MNIPCIYNRLYISEDDIGKQINVPEFVTQLSIFIYYLFISLLIVIIIMIINFIIIIFLLKNQMFI